jgi:hypothetical protein
MTLKVIGAGLPRTGTLSLKAALEELGFGLCYHMSEFTNHYDAHIGFWADAARGKPVDWRTFFASYQAAVDAPTCFFYKELMQFYPDAKVLLTIRDPSTWYDSARATLMRPRPFYADLLDLIKAPFSPYHMSNVKFRPLTKLIWHDPYNGKFFDRQQAVLGFQRHNEMVKRAVPADRLLVFEVKQGWEPLCNFLGVPVPQDKPFPHLNERAATQQTMDKIKDTMHWDVSGEKK